MMKCELRITQFVSGEPELGLEAQIGGGVGVFGRCFSSHFHRNPLGRNAFGDFPHRSFVKAFLPKPAKAGAVSC